MNIRQQMDRIYRETALTEIPWNEETPPAMLVRAVEQGLIEPCRTIELGCGAGNYAVWLAAKGFDVTGVDISVEAIKHATRLAADRGVPCRFIVADFLGDVAGISGPFEFAFEWEVLHHVFPEQRPKYVKNVCNLLSPGAKYLSVCFSEREPGFGGQGKFRDTAIGTTLYFSSESELEELFEPDFAIDDLRTVEISGKRGPHMAVAAWLQRR